MPRGDKDPYPAALVDARWPHRRPADRGLAGGCFWGTQSVFERVKGVLATTAGYAGGSPPPQLMPRSPPRPPGTPNRCASSMTRRRSPTDNCCASSFPWPTIPPSSTGRGRTWHELPLRHLLHQRGAAPHQPGLHCAARCRAGVQEAHRHPGRPAPGLLHGRVLPPGLCSAQSGNPTSRSATGPRLKRSNSSSPSCSRTIKANKAGNPHSKSAPRANPAPR